MLKGFFNVPVPQNEPVLNYGPRSLERAALKAALDEARSKQIDIPMYIGVKEVKTGKTPNVRPPHDHKHILQHYHYGEKSHITDAIDAALASKNAWENLPCEQRAAIFLKAADLLAGPYRAI